MTNSGLILDLDYTIFQTDKIEKRIFEPFFQNLVNDLDCLFNVEEINNIVTDLWKDSWDVVIENYKIPKELFIKSVKVLESLNLNLEISTYKDYKHLEKYSIDKFLVTTGLTSLQNAKIKALNIESDFKEIVINDRLIESETKLEIFKKLIKIHNLNPKNTYVIGDNPNSEIAAGKKLNLKTIQIVRENIEKGNNADYYIKSFEELKDIIIIE